MHKKPLEEYLPLFEKYKKASKGYLVSCCSHEDDQPSLHISYNSSGDKLLVKCFAGCDRSEILDYINGKTVPQKTLSAKSQGRKFKQPVVHGTLCAQYDYTDEDGALLYRVQKYKDPKSFSVRRPARAGEEAVGSWVPSLDDTRKVLYKLPEVLSAISDGKWVFLVEGEKDVDILIDNGLTATTNQGGGGIGKWISGYSESLRGANVVVIPDEDNAGYLHGYTIVSSLIGIANKIKVTFLPVNNKGDVYDFLQVNTVDALKQLVSESISVDTKTATDEEVAEIFQIAAKENGSLYCKKFQQLTIDNSELSATVDLIVPAVSEFQKTELFRQATAVLDTEGGYTGLCGVCFGSGFVFNTLNGVQGIMSESVSCSDSGSKTVVLKRCNHAVKEIEDSLDF